MCVQFFLDVRNRLTKKVLNLAKNRLTIKRFFDFLNIDHAQITLLFAGGNVRGLSPTFGFSRGFNRHDKTFPNAATG